MILNDVAAFEMKHLILNEKYYIFLYSQNVQYGNFFIWFMYYVFNSIKINNFFI